ncbi:WD40 repeat protein [Paramarasmius palmivorus]|uniref:WD40 repeat protein n=1 Tax=Paramarasmius palmivorus TaxID=297713 RepID=A0AAW0E2L2_9AGAR
MYFPTSAARRLATIPALPNIPPEPVLAICPSPRKTLFCSITRSGVSVWRVRPPAVLAFLSRTPTSIIDHGENKQPHWSPDGQRIVIQTTGSYLVLIDVTYSEETVYQIPKLPSNDYLAGPGEGFLLNAVHLHFEGVIQIEGGLVSLSPRRQYILFSTRNPPAVQRIPWPSEEDSEREYDPEPINHHVHGSWLLEEEDFSWLIETEVVVSNILFSRSTGVETWITSDGRAYVVRLAEPPSPLDVSESNDGQPPFSPSKNPADRPSSESQQNTFYWEGTCIHDFDMPRWVQKQRRVDPDEPLHERERKAYIDPNSAVAVAINGKFSLIAVGTLSFPSEEDTAPTPKIIEIPITPNKSTGRVCSMEWSSDGYVLAVGWQNGWGIFSSSGRCLVAGFGVEEHVDAKRYGSLGVLLMLLTHFLAAFRIFSCMEFKGSQLDDRALVYRGADQPDMSVINPESDVWQHIKIPQSYLAKNWPIRYSSLSSDGRLIAIAGRWGLVHYSASSGRWKMFADEDQEQAFSVKGGLLWFHHVLIAAVEVAKSYQIRLYSRDTELSNRNVLHREILSAPVVILSLVDNSLLVYTADNMLHHYLIVPTAETIKLHLCGTISFQGIIAVPSAVRMLSWMIPTAQKHLGDPVDDLTVATVLMVVGGQLVLLRPRKSAEQEVKYDMQIFADHIEFCWIHLRGIRALENSLWAFDGKGIRVWLNALSIEHSSNGHHESVKESVTIPVDFYPLSVLMDKGVIIGAEHEISTRSNLPFALFRHGTSSTLFLQHILHCHLEAGHLREAIVFASNYQHLVYFSHSLEMLLHTVVESEPSPDSPSENADKLLSTVVEFLDHFDGALDVVVGCVRKTEMSRWPRLFNIVGNPKALFETCLSSGRLKTAGSYLIVLHGLEQLEDDSTDAPIQYTPEGAVSISYSALFSSPLSLGASIEQAFGSHPNSLGIIVVRDLPPAYALYRERLLKLAYQFANLDEATREKYTDPASRYSFGWSHGKEIMNGKPDTLKGSYYANPIVDVPSVSAEDRSSYPEYYGANIWPAPDEKGIEGFEEAFKNLGSFIFKVGCQLAVACQPFALSQLSDSTVSLPKLIEKSQTSKARLLHYFPASLDALPKEDEPVDSWCGFHLDHSLLTGLCSAMYLLKDESKPEPTAIPSPSPQSGLYIRTRGGELTKVAIPTDCLAFQTGEALEVATGGKLRATPHCVRVGPSENSDKISRETFAFFMQPDTDQALSPAMTFGQFSKRVFDDHYGSEGSM